jgi:transcriptional regulator with GAF, ATPase, and Fis domain
MTDLAGSPKPVAGRHAQPTDSRSHSAQFDAFDPILEALASTLDLREVFDEVSRVARGILPHDFLCVDLVAEDRCTLHTWAATEGVADAPCELRIPAGMEHSVNADFLVALEVDHPFRGETIPVLMFGSARPEPTWIDVPFDGVRRRAIERLTLRSALRVPIRLHGHIVGGLEFAACTPRQFGTDDLPVASRVASCLALAIGHQRMAEAQQRAAEVRDRAAQLEARVAMLVQELESRGGTPRPVGVSKAWREVLAQATRVAATEATVLLAGESGTGKEVVARLVHRASPRANAPFVALNCAALPEHLLESELFGHEKGAFTGAQTSRPGRIEQAQGGVLFLDEVGEMSPAVQAKFLRVLQEREFQRLGGTRTLKADIRVVAATNRDLERAIARGEFRPDLYYRLHVFEIRLPPLRERADDILPLVEYFLHTIGAEVGRPAAGVSRDARDRLLAHTWPGNVRELRNALERAVILCDGGLINVEHLPIALERAPAAAERAGAGPTDGSVPPPAALRVPDPAGAGALFDLP